MWSTSEVHFREGSFNLTSLEKGELVGVLVLELISLDGYHDSYPCIDAFLMYVMMLQKFSMVLEGLKITAMLSLAHSES